MNVYVLGLRTRQRYALTTCIQHYVRGIHLKRKSKTLTCKRKHGDRYLSLDVSENPWIIHESNNS